MVDIEELCEVLPIEFNNKVLNYLSYDDIGWYIENCRKSYYEEFMDFKYSKDITKYRMRKALISLVRSYNTRLKTKYEVRMLLKDKNTQEIYGGMILTDIRDNNRLEISYFIIPKYQHQHLAEEMVSNFIRVINGSNIRFEGLEAIIQNCNKASIKLVESLGFKNTASLKGRYTMNLVYYLPRIGGQTRA